MNTDRTVDVLAANDGVLSVRSQLATIDKALADSAKARAETDKIRVDIRYEPWRVFGSALLGLALAFGAGATIMKLAIDWAAR